MKSTLLAIPVLLLIAAVTLAVEKKPTTQRNPHPVDLTYYLSNATDDTDAAAISTALMKVKSVSKAEVNLKIGYVQVGFDSHAVSYHQVAQAIADAGALTKKTYDPRLKVRVLEYTTADNAAKVDAILSGKRLLQHVRIEPLDKSKGEFIVHFLPLVLDPAEHGPQGFNGGHLNHPIHDAPPRGLGLTYTVLSEKPATP